MNEEIRYQNAQWFLASRLIPAWTTLAAMGRFSEAERRLLLAIPSALALLPQIDEEVDTSAEVDFYWEDKNWLGRLNYQAGKLEVWSNLCQEERRSRELCAQWQHTALKISSEKGLEKHDPAHLWFWIDCFARFVSACAAHGMAAAGCMVIASGATVLEIDTAESTPPVEGEV